MPETLATRLLGRGAVEFLLSALSLPWPSLLDADASALAIAGVMPDTGVIAGEVVSALTGGDDLAEGLDAAAIALAGVTGAII